MTLKKRLRPIKKSSELRHVNRKICVKIVALELLTKKGFDADLMQYWHDMRMPSCCFDFEWIWPEGYKYAKPVPKLPNVVIAVCILVSYQC